MSLINKIIEISPNKNVSDFHLRSLSPFAYRESGEIKKILDLNIAEKDIQQLLKEYTSKEDQDIFNTSFEVDTAIVINNNRYRANFYQTINGPACVLRKIVSTIPNLEELNTPPILYSIADEKKGLVLVTGPTGSGKSTTLAGIINEINRSRDANIITIEDPVEFIHQDINSIVSHREVHKQTKSFSNALKAALREDPDVILVGELRDLETISMALTAAETGHLVFGTLHTSGAPNTINRLIDVFPPEQQGQIRAQLAESLKVVVTQTLLKKKDGSGRIGAYEIMICNGPIKNLIRENKVHQIPNTMQTAGSTGMITMDKYIDNLIAQGLVDASAKIRSH
jgi:twitching motility protein PilT